MRYVISFSLMLLFGCEQADLAALSASDLSDSGQCGFTAMVRNGPEWAGSGSDEYMCTYRSTIYANSNNYHKLQFYTETVGSGVHGDQWGMSQAGGASSSGSARIDDAFEIDDANCELYVLQGGIRMYKLSNPTLDDDLDVVSFTEYCMTPSLDANCEQDVIVDCVRQSRSF